MNDKKLARGSREADGGQREALRRAGGGTRGDQIERVPCDNVSLTDLYASGRNAELVCNDADD